MHLRIIITRIYHYVFISQSHLTNFNICNAFWVVSFRLVLVLESSVEREHLEVWVTSNPPFPN